MIVLPIVFLIFLVMGAFMYLLVCVDPNSPGPLGAISRFVFGKVPDIMKKLFGTRIYNVFANALEYFFYSNHPLVQIFYLFVAVGGYMMYAYHGFYLLFQDNPLVTNFDSLIGSALALYSFYSFYQACHFKAGIITKENHDQYVTKYKDYYDNIIYLKDNSCKTCEIVKPARSKHCRTCNVCVSRFDHHCVWIKQCVGQKNYKYFLKFIFLHALLCDYGTVIGFRCLYGLILKENLFNARFKDPYTGQPLPTGWMIICRYLFYRETIFVFIVVLCVVMGISLTGFFAYHLSMIRKDTTTNEKMKVSDYKQFFKDDIKRFELVMKEAKNEEEIREAENKSTKAKMYLKKLEDNEKVIGIYAGLKGIFSEPDEVRPIKQKKKKK